MILADSLILKGIESGDIKISPFNPKHINPNSYDLTIAPELKVYKGPILDCRFQNETIDLKMGEGGFVLNPDELYLFRTNEVVGSKKYASKVEGKSSLGRLGLQIHLTAGWIDVGFEGTITLEMKVVKPLIIYPNMKIAQIAFYEVAGEVLESYDQKTGSKYHGQREVTSSQMHKNF